MKNKRRLRLTDFILGLLLIILFVAFVGCVNGIRGEIACRDLGYDSAELAGPGLFDIVCIKDTSITRVPLDRMDARRRGE